MGDEFKHCSIDGCNRNAHYKAGGADGLCCAHYKRKIRHGSALHVHVSKSASMDWIRAHVAYSSNDCLIWPFSRTKQGYGELSTSDFSRLAHRVMCMLAHGYPETAGLDAAHSCGKGHLGCINPKHLRWDTRAGNLKDKLSHGTDNRGDKNPVSKLSPDDVNFIREMRGKISQANLAIRFGVTQSNICKIQKNVSWSYND